MHATTVRTVSAASRAPSTRLVLASLVIIVSVLAGVAPAVAGQASAGELLFYPCSSCHPVTAGATAGLPNKFDGHDVVLSGHDTLGTEETVCLVCHDEASRDPGKLRLADGSLIDITGDVSQVCYRCHSDIYDQWKNGGHGKGAAKCTAAGCHDPHTPGSIYASALMPFSGSGFQVAVAPEREAFTPLAAPAPPPPVETPNWFLIVLAVGLVAAGGEAVLLIRGRLKR